MVLEEPGQTEDDRGGGNDDDVAVRSLDRAQSLRVKWSTHGDVAVHRQQHLQPARVQLPTYAGNVALFTLAAERRPCSNRSISPARRAHSSKPAAPGLLLWAQRGQTDRDGHRTVS